MAAVFVAYTSGDVFMTGVSSTELVSVPFLESLVSDNDMLTIYTDVLTQLAQTVQYFLTFDDVVHWISFGRGLGNLTVNGIIFSDKNSDVTAPLGKLTQAFKTARGTQIAISLGGYACNAVLTNLSFGIQAEPDTMVTWSMNLGIISD